MVCVPCVLVPLILFLWGIIKPLINWFRKPVENSGDKNVDNDEVCSLLSSCPCINKNNKLPGGQVDNANQKETLLKEPIEELNTDKKNV